MNLKLRNLQFLGWDSKNEIFKNIVLKSVHCEAIEGIMGSGFLI